MYNVGHLVSCYTRLSLWFLHKRIWLDHNTYIKDRGWMTTHVWKIMFESQHLYEKVWLDHNTCVVKNGYGNDSFGWSLSGYPRGSMYSKLDIRRTIGTKPYCMVLIWFIDAGWDYLFDCLFGSRLYMTMYYWDNC